LETCIYFVSVVNK